MAINTLRSAPIGVFDSGVGGLSVLREIRRELPMEDLVYAADSAYAPYGDRSADFIEQRATALLQFLHDRGVKAVVVACNTVTGVAIDALRARFPFPIVAMEPAVKPAAAATRSGVIGVLATSGTLSSAKFSDLVTRHGAGVRVLIQSSPRLVEQVEKGEIATALTRSLVEDYVGPLVAQGADAIVLGCTHYPFLAAVIQDVAGPTVTVIDPAVAVSRELRRRLEAEGALADGPNGAAHAARGTEEFWTTGTLALVQPVMAQLWGAPLDVREIPRAASLTGG